MKNDIDVIFRYIEESNDKLRKLFFDVLTDNARLSKDNIKLRKKIVAIKGIDK